MNSLGTGICQLADSRHLALLMDVMADAFDPRFGEGWSAIQLGGALASDTGFARRWGDDDHALGFSLCRSAGPEVELLLVAVRRHARGSGIGGKLLDMAIVDARARRAEEMFLEVRENNEPAKSLYRSRGFSAVGSRPSYYAGSSGVRFDALTMGRPLDLP